MQKDKETFLDPTKEIGVDENLKLEGFPLEFEKQMSHIQAAPYEELTPIKVGTYRPRDGKDLTAYRKKRKKKNKQARRSRKINCKK